MLFSLRTFVSWCGKMLSAKALSSSKRIAGRTRWCGVLTDEIQIGVLIERLTKPNSQARKFNVSIVPELHKKVLCIFRLKEVLSAGLVSTGNLGLHLPRTCQETRVLCKFSLSEIEHLSKFLRSFEIWGNIQASGFPEASFHKYFKPF